MKAILNKYIGSWQFTIEFSKRAGGGYSGKDWIKGVCLVTFHSLTVGVLWISLIQSVSGQ